MCGICGSTNDPRGRAAQAMSAQMIHRGPDDEGTYVDEAAGVSLAARRLSIIDIEGGHQPLANEDRTVWAVLNGEIYNHPALRRHLLEHGHRLATSCDTEVLVHLYEEYGDALVHALEGMFAFALWDTKRQRLLVGRDRFGEKPLFYSETGGNLTFASELTALLAGAPGLGEVDPVAVDAFFVFGYVPGPRSIIQDVKQLPPAHLLAWDAASQRTTVDRYWEPPAHALNGGAVWRDLVDEVEELLDRSVRSRLISDVPLGVFLSGGVDSTLVAALAARRSSAPIRTYTVGYEEGSVNETGAAGAAARLLATDHQELILGSREAAERSVAVLSALDQPIADQALIPLHAIAEFARRDVTVAVGGEGADELFGGYPRYRWLARAEQMARRVPSPLMQAGVATIRRLPAGLSASRLSNVLAPMPPLERHIDWVTSKRRQRRDALYGPALRSRIDPAGIIRDSYGVLDDAGVGLDQTGQIAAGFMRLDQDHWLPDDVLAKADRATMLVSLEMRTPFLHRELAELAAAAPAADLVRGRGKAVVRDVLRNVLPGADVNRAKTAFRTPASGWLRGPLAEQLHRLEKGPLCSEGWFQPAALRHTIDDHVAGRRDMSHVLWPTLALGLWLETLRSDGSA